MARSMVTLAPSRPSTSSFCLAIAPASCIARRSSSMKSGLPAARWATKVTSSGATSRTESREASMRAGVLLR